MATRQMFTAGLVPTYCRGIAAALLALAPLCGIADAGPKRVLFDNTHAETAGNADWIIDTDQPLPVPDQSTVTPATPRTYWLGSISSWGIDLVKRGYHVATLTASFGITYGKGSNPYDLSNFDVFIVTEPNTAFSAAESTAIFHYVANGGGLVAVADHFDSDRDHDGIDSPRIWNKLDAQHLWGASFEVGAGVSNANFTEVWSTNVNSAADDSTIHGPAGTVNGLEFHNGTSLILYPGINPSVRGSVWRNNSPHGNTGAMAARSVYGNGRIFFIGDSSPIDDGSAQPGNTSIFDGWAEAAGGDSLLMLNATAWVARRDNPVLGVESRLGPDRPPYPNPSHGSVRFALQLAKPARVSVDVFDIHGRLVRTLPAATFATGVHDLSWDGRIIGGAEASAGIYFVHARSDGASRWWKVIRVQ